MQAREFQFTTFLSVIFLKSWRTTLPRITQLGYLVPMMIPEEDRTQLLQTRLLHHSVPF